MREQNALTQKNLSLKERYLDHLEKQEQKEKQIKKSMQNAVMLMDKLDKSIRNPAESMDKLLLKFGELAAKAGKLGIIFGVSLAAIVLVWKAFKVMWEHVERSTKAIGSLNKEMRKSWSCRNTT